MKTVVLEISKILGIQVADKETLYLVGKEISPFSNQAIKFLDYLRLNLNNKNLEYKTSYQKFIYLIDRFKRKLTYPNEKEQGQIYELTQKVHSKLTWYFAALKELNPSTEQIRNQNWQEHDKGRAFNKKEIQLIESFTQDNVKLYKYSLKKKNELFDELQSECIKLVMMKKSKTLFPLLTQKKETKLRLVA